MDVTPELKTRLEDLQKRSHATTMVEVFKKSLALYDLVLNQYETKGRIILENDDGTREVLRLL